MEIFALSTRKVVSGATFDCAKVFIICLAVLMLGMAAAPYAAGQNEITAEIRGVVQDTSGAVVPDADVVVTNDDTRVSLALKTDTAGVYSAPFVPLGNYTVTVSMSGFETLVQTGIQVHMGPNAVNVVLRPGAISTKVTVQAEVSQVQTETSERATTVSRVAVTELPSIGEDWSVMTQLVPGVSNSGGGLALNNYDQGAGAGNSFNGSMSYQSTWLIDGGTITYPADQNLNQSWGMPLDNVQEFHIDVANFSSQYSSGTAVFNVITKSGGDTFHGSLFEFVQNDKLDARNFYAPSVPPQRENQFGGTIGGPIKRNKAFFFFAMQLRPESTPTSSIFTFPTAEAREGNFSNPLYPTIYDPSTTTTVAGQTVRTAFQGNLITTINPIALAVQNDLPLPNLPGVVNNYYAAIPYTADEHWFIPKVDYNINAKNRITVEGSYVPRPTLQGGAISSIESYSTEKSHWAGRSADQRENISDNWTISPNFVGEFHISADRWSIAITTPTEGGNFPQTLGFINTPPESNIFPCISITGVLSTGICPGSTARMYQGRIEPSGVFSLLRGKHMIRFGTEFNRDYYDGNGWSGINSASFTFSGISTRNPADPTSTGLGYADFLLGLPQTWSAGLTPEIGERSWNDAMFIQDDFKLKPNLTLNFGVRYTLQAGWGEQYNRIGVFDPNLMNPATGTLGAMEFGNSSDNHGRTTAEDGDYNNWAPRVGFAWSPKKKWSMRGAYGLFDEMWGSDTWSSGAQGVGSAVTGFETSPDNLTPIFNWSQPLPNVLRPTPQTLTPAFLNGQQVWYYPVHYPMPYVQQVYFGVQHEFAGFLADVAYVWTKGTHLPFVTELNQVPASLLGPGNAQVNRPYPQFATIDSETADGLSKYNALQISVRRNFTNGLSLDANYTWSKAMDTGTSSGWGNGGLDNWQIAQNVKANYGLSSNDNPQMFTGEVIYQLPFGKSKSFLNRGGVVNAVVGGWQVSTIWQASSGAPETPVMATNLDGALSGSWYPNRVGSGKLSNPTPSMWFNTSAFIQPTEYTFGDSGRNVLFTPSYAADNLSLAKTFLLRENLRLQIKADVANLTNRVNYGVPNPNIGALGAGAITSVWTGTSGSGEAAGNAPNRIIQLGAKLNF